MTHRGVAKKTLSLEEKPKVKKDEGLGFGNVKGWKKVKRVVIKIGAKKVNERLLIFWKFLYVFFQFFHSFVFFLRLKFFSNLKPSRIFLKNTDRISTTRFVHRIEINYTHIQHRHHPYAKIIPSNAKFPISIDELSIVFH